jgi:hypothetical protein
MFYSVDLVAAIRWANIYSPPPRITLFSCDRNGRNHLNPLKSLHQKSFGPVGLPMDYTASSSSTTDAATPEQTDWGGGTVNFAPPLVGPPSPLDDDDVEEEESRRELVSRGRRRRQLRCLSIFIGGIMGTRVAWRVSSKLPRGTASS